MRRIDPDPETVPDSLRHMLCRIVMLQPRAQPAIPDRCAVCGVENPDGMLAVRPLWWTPAGFVLQIASVPLGRRRPVVFQACRDCARRVRRDNAMESLILIAGIILVVAIVVMLRTSSPVARWSVFALLSIGVIQAASRFRAKRLEPVVIKERLDRSEYYFLNHEFGEAFSDENAGAALPGRWGWTSWRAALRHGPRRMARQWARLLRDALRKS